MHWTGLVNRGGLGRYPVQWCMCVGQEQAILLTTSLWRPFLAFSIWWWQAQIKPRPNSPSDEDCRPSLSSSQYICTCASCVPSKVLGMQNRGRKYLKSRRGCTCKALPLVQSGVRSSVRDQMLRVIRVGWLRRKRQGQSTQEQSTLSLEHTGDNIVFNVRTMQNQQWRGVCVCLRDSERHQACFWYRSLSQNL